MPTTKRISIAPRLVDKITVDLVGKEYVIPLPKASLGLIMADRMSAAGNDSRKVLEELNSWIDAAFGAKEGAKVQARLADPADDLDIAQLVELMEKLAEAATPNPTT